MTGRQDTENRDQDRVAMSRPIRVRYRLFQEFIQEMSTNISMGGMFVATEEPRDPGSQFDFEFLLEDGFTLVKGRAEVAWVRPDASGDGQPAGMGVRFIELEETGKVLIGKIVAKVRKKGRKPFDVIGAASSGRSRAQSPAANPTDTVSEQARPGVAIKGEVERKNKAETEAPGVGDRRRVPRFALLLLAAIVAGLLVVLLFNTFVVRPRIEALEQRLEALSSAGSAPERVPEATAPSESETGGEEAVVIEEKVFDPEKPLDFIQEWARAWSEKRTEDYLACYSELFEPSVDLSREEWENLRRVRIGRGANIQVQVLLAEQIELGPEERIVSFVQAYQSDTYRDRVRKVLRLVWEGEGWKIVEERVVRSLLE
jgi:uncharacterized protein (TIGR02266 family)